MQAALYLCNHLVAKVATTYGGCIKVQTNFYQNLETIGLQQLLLPLNFVHAASGIYTALLYCISL